MACELSSNANFSIGVSPYWSTDSVIYNKIADLVANITTKNFQFSQPSFGAFNFDANIPPHAATLRAPSASNVSTPNFSAPSVPSLEHATYSALRSVIDFSFSSPLVPPISYGEGIHHLTVPSVSVVAPPLNYPVANSLELPSSPVLPSITKPVIAFGDKPLLDSHTYLSFNPKTIAPLEFPTDFFNDVSNQLENIETIVPYQAQNEYDADSALIAKLRELLRGRDEVAQWLASQVILFAADSRRIPVEAKQALDKVYEQAAARNFALPTGIVDAQVAFVALSELEQKQQLIEKIQAEVVDAALGAVLASVRAAIDIEQYHAALYAQYIRGNLSLYKLNVAAASAIYKALLQVLEFYGQVVAQHVDNYNKYVSAVIEQNKGHNADISLALANVTTYDAKVKMYRADVDTLKNIATAESVSARVQALPLQVYRAQLDGLLANYSVLETNVQAYSQAIQNYVKYFQLAESKINSFEAAVRAESSVNLVNESNIRAYAAAWQAERQRAGAYESYVRNALSVLEAEASNFRAAFAAERSYLSGVTDFLQANLQTARSYLDVVRSKSSLDSAYAKSVIDHTRASDRLRLAEEELRIARQMIAASAGVQQARLMSAFNEIKIRSGGALAQAASTIYNVGISASGTAAINAQGVTAVSSNYDFNTRYSYAKTCREEVRPLRG